MCVGVFAVFVCATMVEFDRVFVFVFVFVFSGGNVRDGGDRSPGWEEARGGVTGEVQEQQERGEVQREVRRGRRRQQQRQQKM